MLNSKFTKSQGLAHLQTYTQHLECLSSPLHPSSIQLIQIVFLESGVTSFRKAATCLLTSQVPTLTLSQPSSHLLLCLEAVKSLEYKDFLFLITAFTESSTVPHTHAYLIHVFNQRNGFHNPQIARRFHASIPLYRLILSFHIHIPECLVNFYSSYKTYLKGPQK